MPRVASPTHHDRLVAAAAGFTAEHGWGALTMGKLAELGGVSRQTVYNEVGGKPQLAEAMVMRELRLFLEVVDSAFVDYPDDLVKAIEAAAYRVLDQARVDPLLHAVLSSSQGADSELLPLLTTNSQALLATAGQMVREHVTSYDVALPGPRLDVLIDMVVRLVLSHVMQPTAEPAETAETIAWIAARVLSPESASRPRIRPDVLGALLDCGHGRQRDPPAPAGRGGDLRAGQRLPDPS